MCLSQSRGRCCALRCTSLVQTKTKAISSIQQKINQHEAIDIRTHASMDNDDDPQQQHQSVQDNVIILPTTFPEADIDHIIILIADMLNRLLEHNDLIPLTSATLTRFHSRAPPSISVVDYLRRIVKYTSLEKSCLIIILLYIDRVCENLATFTVSSLTVHRFLITSVTVGSKALCDSYCTNSHYAKVGGISTQELNTLETEFLRLIDWRLTCRGELLQHYYTNLVTQHPKYGFREPLDSPGLSSSDEDDEMPDEAAEDLIQDNKTNGSATRDASQDASSPASAPSPASASSVLKGVG